MKLTGKLTFSSVAVKLVDIDKIAKGGSLILPAGVKGKEDDATLIDYPDHPLQGIVVGVAPGVTVCKEGDTVLFTFGEYIPKPSFINDKGTLYQIFRETDIVMVREGE